MAIERLLSTQNQPLKRPVLVYLECLLLTQSGQSQYHALCWDVILRRCTRT